MPVFIHQPDALEVMASVEGQRWKNYQLHPNADDNSSFNVYLTEWKRINALLTPDLRTKHILDLPLTVKNGDGAIYGWHGWSRYTVRYSGEIWFIKLLSPSEEVSALARAAGFKFL